MELKELFYISEKDWYKLQGWATIAHDEDKNEISGLMTALPQEDGRYVLSDIEILKQENSAANTSLDGDAVASYKMKYAMKHKNKNMKYVWWHSHHTMDAFWSGTDEKEINAWENESFSLALVINLKEEYKFRVSIWKAVGLPIAQHYDIPLTIEKKSSVTITDKMKTLYKELCTNETSIYQMNQTRINYGHHNGFTSNYKREHSLNVEEAYQQLLDEIDEINDKFVEGAINLKKYHNKLKQLNNILKTKDLPFSVVLTKGTTQAVINSLMVTMSSDLITHKDEKVKHNLEQSYIWGEHYGY